MKDEIIRVNDKLIFIGRSYNIAKIFNYAEIFKDKELIVENVLPCPCEKRRK